MNRYDHLIRQAYNGVGIQMFFTLFYTKFVRTAGIGAGREDPADRGEPR